MRISPQYSVSDWKGLDFSKEQGWQRAADIFEDRIKGRFLEIIERIDGLVHAGFVVLALDCLLIETLQQFREGEPETPPRMNEEYFIRFLTGTRFARFFDEPKAKKFYDHIRCGVLHQSEVKGDSLVVISSAEPVVRWTESGDGLIVNRRLFHQELVRCFQDYVVELRDPANADVRARFKWKMDHICRVNASAARAGPS